MTFPFRPAGRGSMGFRCAVINLKWLITLINKKRIKLFQLITANSGPASVKRKNLICLKTDLWPIRMNVWHIVIFLHFIRHQWHFLPSLCPRHCDCLNVQRWLRHRHHHYRHSTDPFHSTVPQTERFVQGVEIQLRLTEEWVKQIVIKRKPDAGNDIFIFMSFSSSSHSSGNKIDERWDKYVLPFRLPSQPSPIPTDVRAVIEFSFRGIK